MDGSGGRRRLAVRLAELGYADNLAGAYANWALVTQDQIRLGRSWGVAPRRFSQRVKRSGRGVRDNARVHRSPTPDSPRLCLLTFGRHARTDTQPNAGVG